MEFEPIKLSDLIGGSNHEEIVARVYGRFDLGIEKGVSGGVQVRTQSRSYQSKNMSSFEKNEEINYTSGPIHINRKMDEKKNMAMTQTSSN